MNKILKLFLINLFLFLELINNLPVIYEEKLAHDINKKVDPKSEAYLNSFGLFKSITDSMTDSMNYITTNKSTLKIKIADKKKLTQTSRTKNSLKVIFNLTQVSKVY